MVPQRYMMTKMCMNSDNNKTNGEKITILMYSIQRDDIQFIKYLAHNLLGAGRSYKENDHYIHVSFTFIVSLNQCKHTIYFSGIYHVLPCFFSKMSKNSSQ